MTPEEIADWVTTYINQCPLRKFTSVYTLAEMTIGAVEDFKSD